MKRSPSLLVGSAAAIGVLAIVVAAAARLSPPRFAASEESSDAYDMPGMGAAAPSFAMRGGVAMDALVMEKQMAYPAPMPSPTAGVTAATADARIIKTGALDLAVASVDEASAKLRAAAAGRGGYVQDASVHEREDGSKFGSMTLRVPAKEFESLVDDAKKLATLVKTETSSGQDVTEQYTDLEAQLRNARAQEAEYLNILKRATTVQDILNVQQYLGGVRSTIESLEGRRQYLENLTAYSTLSVTLSEDVSVRAPSRGFRPLEDARAAVQTLVLLAQALVTWVIWFVVIGAGTLLPLALVAYLIYRLVRFLLRRAR